MKKIYLLLGILLSIVEAQAQQHILLRFSSQMDIPAVNFNEVSKNYQLNSADTKLNGILNSAAITKFTKEFPHAWLVKHANAERLDRVYRVETAGDITKLYDQLRGMKSSSIEGEVYLLGQPELLVVPDDYSRVCFSPFICGVERCSKFQNDLINAPAAWNITTGNPDLKIGVIDVNFRRTQEDLVGKIVVDSAAPFQGGSSHGTATAVLAAGNTNNGVGLASVGYNCKVDLYDLSSTYDGILLAATNGARVINCSWHDGSCSFISYYQDMINMIYDTYHPVIVASAGNGNQSSCGITGDYYPASYNHVISVTAVGHVQEISLIGTCNSSCYKDMHELYPNTPSSAYTHNSNVDLCAPGYEVAIPRTDLNDPDHQYKGGNGTSFSAPMVAGAAALILSVNPLLGPDDVEAILKCTARDVYEIPYNISYLNMLGAGRMDVGLAVQLAQTWVPGSGSQQAAPGDIRWFDILSDGINTIEIEDNCNSNNYPGMCNIGYRLEVTGNPGASFKWLVFYSENGTNVTNSIKTGSSITLTRGIDYPNNNVIGGNLKACVRVNECVHSIYYAENRSSDCFGVQCSISCPSDITITGNYHTPVTESATWIKSAGQTTIDATTNVKLDAHPINGYIELKPASTADYFLSSPDATGVFIANVYNGCVTAAPTLAESQAPNATTAKNSGELAANTGISIYPNPGSGLFFVKHPAKVKQMVISDTQGKLIVAIENHGSTVTQFNLTNMPPGMYMLRLEGVNKIMKIIKQ